MRTRRAWGGCTHGRLLHRGRHARGEQPVEQRKARACSQPPPASWAYLAAPFPTCWCWAPLPSDVVAEALAAYRRTVDPAGELPFQRDLTAALGAWLLGWAGAIEPRLEHDREWGTDGTRARLLRWGQAFVEWSEASGAWRDVAALVRPLFTSLADRWRVATPSYPAFAAAGQRVVAAPSWFSDLA